MKTGQGRVYVCTSVNSDVHRFLCECVRASGREVISVSFMEQRIYQERSRSSGLVKKILRLQMYAAYPLMMLVRVLLSRSNSLFIVTSNTFYTPLLVALLSRLKGSKTIHLLYDLFPDALIVAGFMRDSQFSARVCGLIQSLTQKHCAGCVALGPFLLRHAEQRWGKSAVSAAIDISADIRIYPKPLLAVSSPSKPRIVCHYGGQLGYMHDVDSVIASVLKAQRCPALHDRIEFDFRVSGARSEALMKGLGEAGVAVRPVVPADEWRQLAQHFSIALVSLSPGGATVCLPSKTYGMMSAGLAVIAICPVWSDLGQLVIQNGCGWVVNNSPFESIEALSGSGSPEGFFERRSPEEVAEDFRCALVEAVEKPEVLQARRLSALKAMQGVFGFESISAQWKALLDRVAEKAGNPLSN